MSRQVSKDFLAVEQAVSQSMYTQTSNYFVDIFGLSVRRGGGASRTKKVYPAMDMQPLYGKGSQH